MFRRSFTMVLGVIACVVLVTGTSQWMAAGQLPSAYDPGIELQEAFKTSEKPLLIEFYTDDCGGCQQITPLLHGLYKDAFADKLTLVMIDANNPRNGMYMELFNVDYVPNIYVFHHKKMKKVPIELGGLVTRKDLGQKLSQALKA